MIAIITYILLIKIKMMDIKSGQIDEIFKEVLQDIAGYQETLAQKLQLLTECRT